MEVREGESPRRDWRRLWVKGKAAVLFERSVGRRMTDEEYDGLMAGTWDPPVSTEDLVRELERDPYRPAKVSLPLQRST